jgi:hypothetical protein
VNLETDSASNATKAWRSTTALLVCSFRLVLHIVL